MTVGTDGLATEAAQHHAVLYLVLVFLYHLEECVDAYLLVDVFLAVAGQTAPKHVFFLLGKLEVRLEDWEIVLGGTAAELLEPHAHLLASPTNHTTVVDTHGRVGDDQLLVDAYHTAESLASGAGSQWGVEGKHVVGWFLEGHAVGLETG